MHKIVYSNIDLASVSFISSQECEISVPILLRSCTKFAFPRACVPKMPGTRERKTRNAPISTIRAGGKFWGQEHGLEPDTYLFFLIPQVKFCTVGIKFFESVLLAATAHSLESGGPNMKKVMFWRICV